MKLKTCIPDPNEKDPEPWELTPTAAVMSQVRGVGPTKLAALAEKARDASELAELANQKKLVGLVGPLVAERIIARLEQLGATIAPLTRKRAMSKTDMVGQAGFVIAQMGLKMREPSLSVEQFGVTWSLDLLAETTGGQPIGVIGRRSLDRGTFDRSIAACMVAKQLGVASRFIIVVGTRKGACIESLPAGCGIELKFLGL